MPSTVVGLDIGHGVLRAAEVADAAKARPTLVRYHHVAIPASAVDRGEVVDKATVAAGLRQLWAEGGFKSKNVVIGMGNQRVLVRDITVPRMPRERIKESLPFQVQDILPVPVADTLLDFFPIAEGAEEGRPIVTGLLVAAIKEAVLANVAAVQAAGLRPVEVDLIPFAIARSLLTGTAARGTVAVVHVGAVTTCFVIAVDGVPQFVRIIQNGGNDITNALTTQLGMEARQADQVKRGFGLATEGVATEWRPAIEVIYQATSDLIGGIRNTLSFFMSNRPTQPIDRIFASGGGSTMTGFVSALADATHLPVFVPDALERFAIARSAKRDSIQSGYAGLSVAAGLAIGSKA